MANAGKVRVTKLVRYHSLMRWVSEHADGARQMLGAGGPDDLLNGRRRIDQEERMLLAVLKKVMLPPTVSYMDDEESAG